jgi:hypothetical protein
MNKKKSFKKKVDKKNESTQVNLINQPLAIWDRLSKDHNKKDRSLIKKHTANLR